MKFETFWVVTKPTPVSTLADIIFEATPESLARQFAGGLDPKQIHAFYAGNRAQVEAETAALWLLDRKESS